MPKTKTVFFCTDCGGESVKWQGRCPHCGVWNTMVEEKIKPAKSGSGSRRVGEPAQAMPITDLAASTLNRIELGMSELDNVLGGGLMPGSSLLLGGEPGIGKSTLLLQMAYALREQGTTLYISGEESPQQIHLRAERLAALDNRMLLLAENNLQGALAQVEKIQPKLLIIDSIQAIYDPNITSAAGSVSQVRAVAAAVLELTQRLGCTVILVGHVTKEGLLAGPRVLEHMVDTVLYFEGDRHQAFRLLRTVKNRFGSTNEVGIFEMTGQGLSPLGQPSAYFLSQRSNAAAGSAVSCVIQGSRPLLLEVQALVAPSHFGQARRLAAGYDTQRLLMLLAVLERRIGLKLGDKDVYVNIAGGLRVEDTAIDLAAAAAIVSSLKEQPLDEGLLLAGEVGLLGELRAVGQAARRAKEGAAFGFGTILLPPALKASTEDKATGIRVLNATDLAQALRVLGLV